MNNRSPTLGEVAILAVILLILTFTVDRMERARKAQDYRGRAPTLQGREKSSPRPAQAARKAQK